MEIFFFLTDITFLFCIRLVFNIAAVECAPFLQSLEVFGYEQSTMNGISETH